jgi:hypothetical protein
VIPDPRFVRQPKAFWAHVRTISQHLGYTVRRAGTIKVFSLPDITRALRELGLSTDHILDNGYTDLADLLHAYFQHRADVLNGVVQGQLMDAAEARDLFEETYQRCSPRCPLPTNKQKGAKKAPAYLTGLVNMLIEEYSDGLPVDYDPRELTTVTRDGAPLRTLARRVDGAFPGPVNPIAVWEIKEYYYTTTFGSRVADGVYETLLDGMELEELREHEGVDVKHYLMVDSHYTWWECGRSYLCRIVDMLHMGYVDEVMFGREVAERLPVVVPEWVTTVRARST